jgi:hypothetical protein
LLTGASKYVGGDATSFRGLVEASSVEDGGRAQRCNKEKTAVAAGRTGAWGSEAEEWRAEVARPQASCWLQGR